MAMILDAFAGKMVDRLAEFVEEKVVTVLGVKDELRRLQRRMRRIRNVLQDAERKRVESEQVADWVRELKDVMYDADDIIDLCGFEGGKLLDDQPSASSDPSSVRCNFPSFFSCFTGVRFRHEIGGRIKKLNERLDEISKDISDLKLIQSEPDIRVIRVDPRQTTSLVDPSDIVGGAIECATEDLVKLILRKDEQRCRVIAITGMGGIGKTTLAQKIFNHEKMKSGFSTKIWTCVSQNFSEIGLLKEIIRGAGGDPGDKQTKAELSQLLESAVSGKPFFLVLDDAWREDVWVHLLRVPLQSGAVGSCVLVTTRDRKVAIQMNALHIHPVKQLPVEYGWELLRKNAFVAGEEGEMQSLGDVGFKIVEKCRGLPLAIKTIAGVLKMKRKSEGEWEMVLRRDAWSMDKLPDDLRGALYLSYEDLPSHLKQCFLFCSLFPEDYKFSRRDLVKYWVVEGFADTQNDLFLEVSEEYFEELIRRNLIENAHGMHYKMHDLLRSLAQFLSRDESFCGEVHQLATISTTTKLRRLTVTGKGELAVIPDPLLQQKNLRTIFLEGCPRLENDWFVRFSFLRFLLLSDSGIENIPDALGNLIHLRLLDLDRTKISSLPESIRYLTNLQVLNLSGCRSLHTLPNGITQLCNLWYLHLEGTPLSFMPAGMGRLKELRIVTKFVVGENGIRSGERQEQVYGCGLEELKSLMQLRELSVFKLESAAVAQNELQVLKNKPNLKRLGLCGTVDYPSASGETVEYSEEATNKIEEVLEELFPPPCLESLDITEYFGRGFPSWMMSSSLATSFCQLRSLSLSNCTKVQQLPPLGLLPELRDLEIYNASGVATSGPDFFGSSSNAASVSFPKLESLSIGGMQNLKELLLFCGEEEEVVVLPRLQELVVWSSALMGIENFPNLTDRLNISDCRSLQRISRLPKLKQLIIYGCPSLKCVEKLDALESLTLTVDAEYGVECLPEWLLSLLQQRQQQQHHDDNFLLELRCDKRLLKRCLRGCEYWSIIENIPRVEAHALLTNTPTQTSWSSFSGHLLYTKEPFTYETNL